MSVIEHAITLLKEGKLVAIPTETVYGLGADAKNPSAIQKVYTAKGRPATNPLIIHVPKGDAIIDWAIDIPSDAWQLAEHFWPGPLTLILNRHPHVPKIVTGGQETVALRVPKHPLTLELLHRFGGGIAAPSANRYGRISPTTMEHVQESLGLSVDYILDGGACTIGIESTIVSLLGSDPVILRAGSITREALTKVLGRKVLEINHKNNIKVPGSNISHYAPIHPLYLLEKEDLFKMALKRTEENKPCSVLSFSDRPTQFNLLVSKWAHALLDPSQYAQQLYSQLHTLDKTNSDCILVEMPPTTKEWRAVIDRLQRAAYRED